MAQQQMQQLEMPWETSVEFVPSRRQRVLQVTLDESQMWVARWIRRTVRGARVRVFLED